LRLALGTMVCTVVALTGAPATAGAAQKVEIEVIPAKVELSPSTDAKATVLVTNAGDEPVSALELVPVATGSSPAGATVTPAAPQRLGAGATSVYSLSLPPWGRAGPPSAISLLAKFRTAAGSPQATGTAVELLPPTPIDVDKIASVEIKASLATLRSDHTEPVYLLVTNKSARPLTVEKVLSKSPSFITFDDLQTKVEVAPGQTAILTLDAEAGPRVVPGEHQLVFRLVASSGGTRFNLVASQAAKVGVTGEAEALAVFGVPSLLVLPGFLLIAAASIFWRLRIFRKDWDGDAFPFALKEPEFWVLAVIFSIAIVFVAKCAKIDLLGQYGLEDLVLVWIASMLLGVAIYLCVIPLRNRKRAARVPGADDDPLQLLAKLAKQGLSLDRPSVSYDTDSGSAQLFLVQPASETRPASWAAPRITYTWMTHDPKLDQKIQDQLDKSRDAGALVTSLHEGLEAGKLRVEYAKNALTIRSPTLLPKDKIHPGARMVMVRATA
jgi:hypothetical protein